MHLIEAEGQFSVTVGTALILWVPYTMILLALTFTRESSETMSRRQKPQFREIRPKHIHHHGALVPFLDYS